jgi:hypothetical protein
MYEISTFTIPTRRVNQSGSGLISLVSKFREVGEEV